MTAWSNWLHCCGSTYGEWLRGDPRGWRARHHREHVKGDYKAPPPRGKYDELYAESKRLMKRERVKRTPEQRAVACRVIVESLLFHQVEVLAVAVSAKHWHVLARFHELGSILTADRTRAGYGDREKEQCPCSQRCWDGQARGSLGGALSTVAGEVAGAPGDGLRVPAETQSEGCGGLVRAPDRFAPAAFKPRDSNPWASTDQAPSEARRMNLRVPGRVPRTSAPPLTHTLSPRAARRRPEPCQSQGCPGGGRRARGPRSPVAGTPAPTRCWA